MLRDPYFCVIFQGWGVRMSPLWIRPWYSFIKNVIGPKRVNITSNCVNFSLGTQKNSMYLSPFENSIFVDLKYKY